MPKLFQINEDDLSVLERFLPVLADPASDRNTPSMRVKIRRVQGVLSRIRWNYGPHEYVERIEGNGE